MELLGLLADGAKNFPNRLVRATNQACRCSDSATFCQATDNLNDFRFVQTQPNEPALLVEGFAARGIETTIALHRAGFGFETAELLYFTATM
jgi:hypothetical protein